MKFSATLALAAAGSLAAAEHNHRRGHAHHHKRDVATATTVVDEVITVYQLDGTPIPVADVCKGIKDGDYKWANGAGPAHACDPVATSTSVSVKAHQFLETSTSSAVPTTSTVPTTTAVPTTSSTPTTTSTTSTSTSTTSISTTSSSAAASTTPASTGISGGTGLTAPFPDGELSCDTFPSDYGAVALDYHGLGGYSGIQYPTMNALGTLVQSIVTAVTGQSCTEGAYCSYHCPPGYLKSQWPKEQGATGQSVGGITCTNGKLHRTNTEYDTLCIAGVEGITVKNTLGGTVSACRTDYPGTESETLPLEVNPGSIENLANPNGASYFFWENKQTSAQYYLNPVGFGADKACVWGTAAYDLGNFAPMNMGVGFSDGTTYLSLFPNKPTTDAQLKYNVKIVGDVSLSCSYVYDGTNGMYYENGTPKSAGCTVGVPQGGSAQVVFY
ncbi:hypothetical protein BGW36DRAFT_368326 [Talaromyces proteolyticus]|uniref:Uncharacterized protein n=1 Tax=Talaromyces proteolyticus TaxID=1131652 RepID=A0AAD4L8K7_9EURO|nr:uncharacterized protein BGW36DRAFT_368326 [Talaromyces proteolyticus]KAH8705889.1 hypothetical protein BGW36DRAFT_368326 [Talaromyces proteolyticus]